jgi:hypothetical protein
MEHNIPKEKLVSKPDWELTPEEAEELIQAVDDIYFGGLQPGLTPEQVRGKLQDPPTTVNRQFIIQFFPMNIEGLDGEFIVAKLRRISSPPVQVGSIGDPATSTLRRLADIFRLGRASQNFVDLKSIERLLKEDFDTDPETEWVACERVVCSALGIENLAALPAVEPVGKSSTATVSYQKATMKDRPYTVARVGSVFGSPAPTLLTHPNHRESALARLRDVFRIGVHGQAFRDLVEAGLKQGRTEAEIAQEWTALATATVAWAAPATTSHRSGIDSVEGYRGWKIYEEHSESGRRVFSALMDGTGGYILDMPSREEVIRMIDEREG